MKEHKRRFARLHRHAASSCLWLGCDQPRLPLSILGMPTSAARIHSCIDLQ